MDSPETQWGHTLSQYIDIATRTGSAVYEDEVLESKSKKIMKNVLAQDRQPVSISALQRVLYLA